MSFGAAAGLTVMSIKSLNVNRQIYLNISVRDLKRSMTFFSTLGFELNPKFTDDKAACLVIGTDSFVMLLSEPFFQGFTKREVCDTSKQTEALICVSCARREDVDTMVNKALAAGGSAAMAPQDHGFMYGWSFYDPDGHHWEVMWMDPKAAQ